MPERKDTRDLVYCTESDLLDRPAGQDRGSGRVWSRTLVISGGGLEGQD